MRLITLLLALTAAACSVPIDTVPNVLTVEPLTNGTYTDESFDWDGTFDIGWVDYIYESQYSVGHERVELEPQGGWGFDGSWTVTIISIPTGPVGVVFICWTANEENTNQLRIKDGNGGTRTWDVAKDDVVYTRNAIRDDEYTITDPPVVWVPDSASEIF